MNTRKQEQRNQHLQTLFCDFVASKATNQMSSEPSGQKSQQKQPPNILHI